MKDYSTYQDRELFEHISKGDELAFEVLYKKYTRPLYAYVLKVLKTQFWAEEIVQDIFMNLWINRHELAVIDNPSAFLYRMTANRIVDWIRKNDTNLKVAFRLRQQSLHNSSTTEEIVNFRVSDALIKEAINNLSPQRKLIYKLKNDTGLSYDEIATQLEISKHTVRNQLVKSLENIKKYLIEKGAIVLVWISVRDF